ncbi:prolyl-tRNA synthetase associated domain-containing protein [Feifania hominis]|uniref:Prolyl-tRNA synthetase associated domain-containing protein n=1 Tax=Feifania hominis TaxID=2763660 RepID=A0A926DHA3_9FIRM|nr:prolyl-tRNA synthetase associated domain-containing protein [Feifania hominis]MBC8537060.1 prolyl-tRNA synthetase associated domain-containing protein [Feifania hominis]
MTRSDILARLDAAGIAYELEEHPAVFTIDEMRELGICERGEVAKNLFLRDAKGRRHILAVVRSDKRADLAAIAEQLGTTRLSFASEQRLMKHLGLTKGAVTPLGVLHDSEGLVEVAIDRDLCGCERLGVHPGENTATLWLRCDDLLRLIRENGNPVSEIVL